MWHEGKLKPLNNCISTLQSTEQDKFEEDIEIYECNINENNWYYKGEGNANLIIALKNEPIVIRIPKFEPEENEIMKSQTQITTKTKIKETTENDYNAVESQKKIIEQISFYKKVILPLFTNVYFQVPEIGIMSEHQIDILNAKLKNVRPIHRRDKIIKPGYVTICHDLTLIHNIRKYLNSHTKFNKDFKILKSFNGTEKEPKEIGFHENNVLSDMNEDKANPTATNKRTLPSYCVELKPKQGWNSKIDDKIPKCIFCLNQYLKLKEKSIKIISNYCPLDLFSGSETRIIKSLKLLLKTPQNNFKIFKNGEVIYDEHALTSANKVINEIVNPNQKEDLDENVEENINHFCYLIFKVLTKDNMSNEDIKNNLKPKDKHLFNTEDDLNRRENNIIGENNQAELKSKKESLKIQPHQTIPKRVPAQLIDTLYNLMKEEPLCNYESQRLPEGCILNRILNIQKLDTYGADYVHNYFKLNFNERDTDVSKSCSIESKKRVSSNDNQYGYIHNLLNEFPRTLNPIESYLLSTTAKDCSILISFQRLHNFDLEMDSAKDMNTSRDGTLNDCRKLDSTEETFKYKDNVAMDMKNIINLNQVNYVCNVNVVDVDMKPIRCIEKHCIRDLKIVNASIDIIRNKDHR